MDMMLIHIVGVTRGRPLSVYVFIPNREESVLNLSLFEVL